MGRLLITADLHGSLNAWLTITALLGENDSLVVAGDLFDTRYGSYGNPDFAPDQIKTAVKELNIPLYYVYGNCDVAAFFPGKPHDLDFQYLGKKIFVHHGHQGIPRNCRADIIIQGHTHVSALEKKGEQVFLNPGSITHPRNSLPSYGIIEQDSARIMELKIGKPLISLPL